jgi:hypothetical protein
MKRKPSCPTLPTRALMFLLAVTLQLSLPGCGEEKPGVVLATAKSLPPTKRVAYIKKQIAKACPVPLTDEELDRAANYVMFHASDLESVWLTGRLDRMDAETRICRGMK